VYASRSSCYKCDASKPGYSGDHGDEVENMAFTDENDFEGGQWVDGEYYYK
jgi:hypothetical protein